MEETVYSPQIKPRRFGLPHEFRWPLIWVVFFAVLGIIIQSINLKSLVFGDFFWKNYIDWFAKFGTFTNVTLYPNLQDIFHAIVGSWYYFFYTGGLISLIWAIISKIINFEMPVRKKVQDPNAPKIEESTNIKQINEENLQKLQAQIMTNQGKSEQEQEARKQLGSLIIKGENYILLQDQQKAREIYAQVKSLYDPKLDTDNKLYERILKFYNSIEK